ACCWIRNAQPASGESCTHTLRPGVCAVHIFASYSCTPGAPADNERACDEHAAGGGMCPGCIDDNDSPPSTRREFLAKALQLTAASALGTAAMANAAIRVWDVDAKGHTVDNAGTLLPAYTAVPMGAANRTTVIILHDEPGIPPDLQSLARDVARTGYIAMAIDCAMRGTAKISTHPDALLSEAFCRDVQSDVRAGIVSLNGDQPDANPVVILGFGWAGYTALRMALNDPLSVVGVIAMSTPIEATVKSKTDPRPDLI